MLARKITVVTVMRAPATIYRLRRQREFDDVIASGTAFLLLEEEEIGPA